MSKRLSPVRPNAGVAADYRRRLDRLIDEMNASTLYWIKATYRANTPEMAQDVSPAMAMRQAMRRLSRRWERNFAQLANELASYFAKTAAERSDSAMRAQMRKAGFTVKFRPTRAQNDAMQAIVGENVALIKSIPANYLTQVEGSVMRSVATGRDLATLAAELEEHYGVTKRRAAFIARDQNNKATSALTRVRQTELGIKKARWRHSHAGKHPRVSHVEADGEVYDIAKGMLIDDEWIFPGEKPNCRCTGEPIIEGFNS